ncbi:hypothetical protein GN956_G18220 [Arapaima gigas]
MTAQATALLVLVVGFKHAPHLGSTWHPGGRRRSRPKRNRQTLKNKNNHKPAKTATGPASASCRTICAKSALRDDRRRTKVLAEACETQPNLEDQGTFAMALRVKYSPVLLLQRPRQSSSRASPPRSKFKVRSCCRKVS